MAVPTFQNTQITDSITQANTKVVSEGPATASLGSEALALALALARQNPQPPQILPTAQPAGVEGLLSLYRVDTAASGNALEAILAEAGRPPKSPTDP